jgi:hypothetical protein
MEETGAGRERLDVADEDDVKQRLAETLHIGSAGSSAQAAPACPARTSTFGGMRMSQGSADGDCAANTTACAAPSIMELMMEEAAKAKAAKEERLKESKRPNFGDGLKKGFLSSSSSSARNKGTTKIKPKPKVASKDVPTIAPKSGSASEQSPLVLSEVQDAMKAGPGATLAAHLESGEWVTPDLQERITSNPKLASALQNPQFVQVLSLMKTDPEKAKELISRDPQAREVFLEFSSLLGEHFTALGQGQDAAVKDIGPLAEAALQRSQATPKVVEDDPELDREVQAVLADSEIRELLSDQALQRVLMECSDPRRLRHYVQDPTYGPKLRKLKDAGLVAIQ